MMHQSAIPFFKDFSSFFAVILVTGFQFAILYLGRGRLDAYVDCLEESLLRTAINPENVSLLANTSLPVIWIIILVVFIYVWILDSIFYYMTVTSILG